MPCFFKKKNRPARNANRAIWEACYALTARQLEAMGWTLHPAYPAPGWDPQNQSWEALFLAPPRNTDVVTLGIAFGPRLGFVAKLRQYHWPGAPADLAAIGTDVSAWHAAQISHPFRVLGLTDIGGWPRKRLRAWPRIEFDATGAPRGLERHIAALDAALDRIPRLAAAIPEERGPNTYRIMGKGAPPMPV